MDDTRAFYDDLAGQYHLIYQDWWRSVTHQGERLASIIEAHMGPGGKRVLDCTAGIGTQALGLASVGHEVVGTDLSEQSVDRAREEAASRGLSADFRQWDVREISQLPGPPFDVVISADNALPHLLDLGDLRAAASGIWSKVRSGGLVLVSIRDYDQILQTRPPSEGPRVLGTPGDRRVVLQLWEWDAIEPIYTVEHLILTEGPSRWETGSRTCRYRALSRAELGSCFDGLPGASCQWLMPPDSGFFQPMLKVAKAGEDGAS